MGLVGVVGVVVLLVDGLISDGSYLMIVLAGGLADDLLLVERVDHVDETALHDARAVAHGFHHKFKGLTGPDHGQVVFLLSQHCLLYTSRCV